MITEFMGRWFVETPNRRGDTTQRIFKSEGAAIAYLVKVMKSQGVV